VITQAFVDESKRLTELYKKLGREADLAFKLWVEKCDARDEAKKKWNDLKI
jgi:hypothetical protein